MRSASHDSPRREHQPALDGVRGFSVTLVLLFHGGFSFMTGGYVGVSTFFTLSGFLITGLLLDEQDHTGRISLTSFYARRAKRLVPASLLCLAAVSVAAHFGEFDGLAHLRRDIVASLLQIANWNALVGGTSYADLVARSTGQLGPVDHFWSLAVEEQFYLVWPVVCALLLRRRPAIGVVRRRLVIVAFAGVAVAPLIAGIWGANAAYWSTPARLGEILTGAALAAILHGRVWTWRGLSVLGWSGLFVIVVAAVSWPAGSGPAYSGWLGVFSLASVALVAGLQVPGPLRSVMGAKPLAYLGRISYGVYLYHWPIFAALDEQRLGAGGWTLFGIRVSITLVVAIASFHLIEVRIRRREMVGRRVAVVMVGSVAAATALAVLLVPLPVRSFGTGADVPQTFAPTSSSAASSVPTTAPTGSGPGTTVQGPTTAVPSGPVRVLLLGDSTMAALSEGLSAWASAHPDQMQVASLAAPGCGLIRDSTMDGDPNRGYENECARRLREELPSLLSTQTPDVVMIMVTLPDVVDRTWSEAEGMLALPDPRYVERLRVAYESTADSLVAAGIRHIAWVVPPRPGFMAEADWVKWETFVGVVLETAGRHSPFVTLVRLDEWLAAQEDAAGLLPDGLHLTPDGALAVSERFIAAELQQTAWRGGT